jgi:hypothetical protein
MASLVARALMEEHPQGDRHDPRTGIDRVLLSTFWRPDRAARPAAVISLAARRPGARAPTSRG